MKEYSVFCYRRFRDLYALWTILINSDRIDVLKFEVRGLMENSKYNMSTSLEFLNLREYSLLGSHFSMSSTSTVLLLYFVNYRMLLE